MLHANARGAWDVLLDKVSSFVGRRVPPSDVDDVVQEPLDHVRGLPDLKPEEWPVDLVWHCEGAVFFEIDVEALLLRLIVFVGHAL